MTYDPAKVSGMGLDHLDESLSMPLLNIIQQNSPQLNPRKDEYIEGAKPGDIWFSPTGEVREQPVPFIPCAFRTLYVEWRPRDQGGGLVGMHPLTVVTDPRYKKGVTGQYDEWLGDNELKKTTYVLGLIGETVEELNTAMIALSSTGQRVGRKLQADIRKFRYGGEYSEITPPVFARQFKVSSEYEENSKGGFFNFHFGEPRVLDFEEDERLLSAAEEQASSCDLMLPAPSAGQAALTNDGDTPF